MNDICVCRFTMRKKLKNVIHLANFFEKVISHRWLPTDRRLGSWKVNSPSNLLFKSRKCFGKWGNVSYSCATRILISTFSLSQVVLYSHAENNRLTFLLKVISLTLRNFPRVRRRVIEPATIIRVLQRTLTRSELITCGNTKQSNRDCKRKRISTSGKSFKQSTLQLP